MAWNQAFTDNFQRADGSVGNGWTDLLGVWSISSNTLTSASGDYGTSLIIRPEVYADQRVVVRYTPAPDGDNNSPLVWVRASSSGNGAAFWCGRSDFHSALFTAGNLTFKDAASGLTIPPGVDLVMDIAATATAVSAFVATAAAPTTPIAYVSFSGLPATGSIAISGLQSPNTVKSVTIYRQIKSGATNHKHLQVGDSITQGTGSSDTAHSAASIQIATLQALGISITGVNQGVYGSDTTLWTPGTANFGAAAIAGQGCDTAQITFGVNDANTSHRANATDFGDRISRIAAGFMHRIATLDCVLLNCATYSNDGNQHDATSNSLVQQYAVEYGLLVNDSTILFGDMSAYAKFASDPTMLSGDFVHPPDAGHAFLGGAWARALGSVGRVWPVTKLIIVGTTSTP